MLVALDMIVTLKRLERLGACPGGLDRFRKEFGTKAKVTRERLILFKADVRWIAATVFPSHFDAFEALARNAERAYDRKAKPLQATLHAAIKPHDAMLRAGEITRRHHEDATQPHWSAYMTALGPHYDAYGTALANVLADVLGLP